MDPMMQAMLAANMGTMPGGMMGGDPAAMPTLDPAAHMYMTQMMQSLLLQNQAQQAFGATAAGTLPGMPPVGFPGLAPPYTQAPPTDPTITVSVEGMKFQYQLTADDLMKVFSRYGAVSQIKVDEAGASATVKFNQVQDAQSAMTDLNGKVLNGLDGTLRINWLYQPAPAALPAPYPAMPFPAPWGGFPTMPPGGALATPGPSAAVGPGAGGGGGAAGGEKSPGGKGVRKYTCRFLIGIENDKEFQVARRIIGPKGAHMKRIVKQTEAKLRLRGVGSGYYEGAGQKESAEPLQLCVSCTTQDGYKTAVSQVEDLLKRVYEEYRQFCRENGMSAPDLHINLSENQLYSRFGGSGGGGGGADDDDDAGSPSKANGSSRRGGRRSRGKREGGGRQEGGETERGEPGPNAPPVEEIERYIDERNEARRANNFAEADRIRELLHTRGVALMDEPGGRGRGTEVTTWRYWRD